MTALIKLYCPGCGKLVKVQVSEGEHTDRKVTCKSCGTTSEVGHLRTVDGTTLLQHAEDIAKEAFEDKK